MTVANGPMKERCGRVAARIRRINAATGALMGAASHRAVVGSRSIQIIPFEEQQEEGER